MTKKDVSGFSEVKTHLPKDLAHGVTNWSPPAWPAIVEHYGRQDSEIHLHLRFWPSVSSHDPSDYCVRLKCALLLDPFSADFDISRSLNPASSVKNPSAKLVQLPMFVPYVEHPEHAEHRSVWLIQFWIRLNRLEEIDCVLSNGFTEGIDPSVEVVGRSANREAELGGQSGCVSQSRLIGEQVEGRSNVVEEVADNRNQGVRWLSDRQAAQLIRVGLRVELSSESAGVAFDEALLLPRKLKHVSVSSIEFDSRAP